MFAFIFQIISVYETALPYCLDPYTLNTLGKDDLGGCIQLSALAAHFRLDMIKKVHVVTCAYIPVDVLRVCISLLAEVCEYKRASRIKLTQTITLCV